jgi:molybdopterin-guanine dinucleotide biosynthesis protein A
MKTSLVIQAGGQSSRMGTNKALLMFKGQPLIHRILQRLQPVADETLITSNQPEEMKFLGVPVFPDLIPGAGALGGLYTALHFATYPVVAVIATDLPFASLDLISRQIQLLQSENVDVVIPASTEGYEPFHAVYRRETCLIAVKQALDSGQKRLISWFPAVKVRTLTSEELLDLDPTGRAFINVNTPEELAQAEALED